MEWSKIVCLENLKALIKYISAYICRLNDSNRRQCCVLCFRSILVLPPDVWLSHFALLFIGRTEFFIGSAYRWQVPAGDVLLPPHSGDRWNSLADSIKLAYAHCSDIPNHLIAYALVHRRLLTRRPRPRIMQKKRNNCKLHR